MYYKSATEIGGSVVLFVKMLTLCVFSVNIQELKAAGTYSYNKSERVLRKLRCADIC
jgi:hypothetical protein